MIDPKEQLWRDLVKGYLNIGELDEDDYERMRDTLVGQSMRLHIEIKTLLNNVVQEILINKTGDSDD